VRVPDDCAVSRKGARVMANCAKCPRPALEGGRYCVIHKPARWWRRWTRRRWYAIFASLALIIFPVAAYFYDETLVGPVIYLLTAFLLLAYTIETYGLRVQMIRQNEITIQPLLILNIGPSLRAETWSGAHPDAVILQNIGRGPALFVRIDDIPILVNVDNAENALVVRFDTVDVVEAGKSAEARVGFFSKEGGKLGRQQFDFLPNLRPKTARDTFKVVIRYEDVDSGERFSVMQMGKLGIRLLQHDSGQP
jgi:hypothetical protein